MIGLGHRIALHEHPPVGGHGIRHAVPAVLERIGPGPVRRLAVQVFAEQGQRPAADPEPDPAARAERRAVVRVVGGEVLAGLDVHERGDRPLAHDEVDHPRDRVRPVLRRGAVAQHFDPVDRDRRDRVEVHAGRSRAGAVRERIHHRGLVAPQAVDQHQGVVGAEPPQREGTHYVGRVGDRLPREVHRRRQRLEDLAGLASALLRELGGEIHVHRHRQLVGRGVPRPGADDHLEG